jgi:DNA-binding response OmpR family regulator
MTGTDDFPEFERWGLRFEPWVRTVAVDDRRTLLDPRSGSVFETLARRFGQCVTKEELLRTAWPGQIVQENSLAKAISKLRQAIAGSDIEIVASYGLGYVMRTVEGAVPREPEPEPRAALGEPVPAPRERPVGKAVALGLTILLLAGAGAATIDRARAPAEVRKGPLLTHDAPGSVATILWVDDHPSNNSQQVADFRKNQIAVHLAETTEDALKLLAMNHYDLVISDLGRGEDRLAGLKMTEALRARGDKVPVLIYTIRAKDVEGQAAQRRMVAEAGATGLVVTPQEVRTDVLRRLSATSS